MKRPFKLECQIFRYYIGDQNYIVFVGLQDGKPYELFAGKQDSEIFIPPSIKYGMIIKTFDEKGKRYDFIYTNSMNHITTVEGISYLFRQEFKDFNIFMSFILRLMVKEIKIQNQESIRSLIDNLLMDLDYKGHLGIWKQLVINVLKNYSGYYAKQDRFENFY